MRKSHPRSLDNVVTLIGMTDELTLMIVAIVLSAIVLFLAAPSITSLVLTHGTVKILTLSVVLLIGMSMIAQGSGFYIPKGYIYFATGFAAFVVFLGIEGPQPRDQEGADS